MSEKKQKNNPAKQRVPKSPGVSIKTLRYFFPIAWRYQKGYFFTGLGKAFVDAIQPFVRILVAPLIIDELLGQRRISQMVLYVTVISVTGFLLSLTGSILQCQLDNYDEKFKNYFSEMMCKHVMELDFQLTEDKKALDQIELARTGMDWYSGGVHGLFSEALGILSAIIRIAGVVTLIAVHAPMLFLLVLAMLGVHIYSNYKVSRLEIYFHKQLAKVNRAFSYLGYDLVNIRYGKDIRLYGAQEMMVNRWEQYSVDSLNHWKAEGDGELHYAYFSVAAGVIRDFCMYLYLGIRVITGHISIGTFSQMLSACGELENSLYALSGGFNEISKRSNYAYEFVKFMDYPAAIEKGNRPVSEGAHTIEFRDVSFSYPKTDVQVLSHVNLILHPGEHLSVVGLNGAGKTTFVKLLCRLYDPTEGDILLDGVSIREYDYEQYMNLFSPVFQDFKLFAFSIKENITMTEEQEHAAGTTGSCADGLHDKPSGGDSAPALDTLFAQVGLSEKINSLERGAETMLFKSFDKEGIEPSGGEQQKLAIARALYKRSPVVILDEPTAALDPVAEYEIYRQFHSLVGGKTAIYISHRLSSCRFCDRIAVFSGGRIAEYGTHEELEAVDGGIYAEMFAAQAQYYR